MSETPGPAVAVMARAEHRGVRQHQAGAEVVGRALHGLPKIIVAFLISFFPIIVNLVLGLRSPDRSMLMLMRSMNAREAVREATIDVEEGADVVMVKPALPYLDVIQAVRAAVPVPVAAYHVSGEYAALKAAAARGWLDERQAVLESLTAIRRAGADMIVTYHAREVAEWLHE